MTNPATVLKHILVLEQGFSLRWSGWLDSTDSCNVNTSVTDRLTLFCRLRQREFFTFGMDVLLKLDLKQTREFFAAFFNLSDYNWQV